MSVGSTANRTQVLSRAEALRLLEDQAFVGRVAFTDHGRTTILPVNYLAENGAIVFCTAAESSLSAIADGAEVAFEVDSSRPLFHAGWSVVVHGTAREVTDPVQLERLRYGPLKSWAVSTPGHWMAISINEVSGRSIAEA